MDPAYGQFYRRLYQEHWWWRAREEYLTRLLDRLLGDGAAGDILDFGCGDGLFFPALRKYGEPWGIEPDSTLLDPAGPWRERIRSELEADAGKDRHRFGLVIALDVLEHIDEPLPVVRALRERLRPGGLLVATVPAFQSMWTGHDDINRHVRRYRTYELAALMRAGGIEVLEVNYFFVWSGAAKWLVALKERLTGPDRALPLIPAPAINRMLLGACRIEQRLLGQISVPFGSSAVIVGRTS